VLKRTIRGAYWLGLFAGPFLGAALVSVGVFVAMHSAGQGRDVLPPVVIGVGLVSWMGLIRAYRMLIPLPCAKCGRSAKATSLNPITVRCGSCGHVQEFATRVLGAP
jgi:hypothetical protein